MPTHCEASFDELKTMLSSILPEFLEFKDSYEKVYGELGLVQFSAGKAHTEIGTFDFPWPKEMDNESLYASKLGSIAHFCLNKNHRNWMCSVSIDSGSTQCELSEAKVVVEETANK